MAEAGTSPDWLSWHPTLPVLICTNETGERFEGDTDIPDSTVTSYRLTPRGGLALSGRCTTGGQTACHIGLHPRGRFLAVANHGAPGSAAVISLDEDGAVGELCAVAVHPDLEEPGETVDEGKSHVHSCNFDATGRWLLACDKGQDKVVIYRFDEESGGLTRHSEMAVSAGGAARHLALHADGRHLVLCEESGNMVTVCAFDADAGELTALDSQPTLPDGVRFSATSEIQLHQMHGKSLIYCANRSFDGESTIATFALDEDGDTPRLIAKGHAACGDHPRHFAPDPSGRWLLVAAMADSAITVMPLDEEGVPNGDAVKALSLPFATHVEFLGPERAVAAAAAWGKSAAL